MAKVAMGLLEQLYRYWQPHVVERDEVSFYRKLIEEAEGSALELACASGRLLLRFLGEGFPVEGVDASPAMLELLRGRARKLGKEPVLYTMKIDEVELAKLYRLIYISLGSFQLISDRIAAKIALGKYYRLLDDGGKLVIPLFIPGSDRSYESPNWRIVGDSRSKSQGVRYVRREMCTHDQVEQVIEAQIRYEKWQKKDLLELVENTIRIRWYSRGEFESLLKEAGFSGVEMQRSYGERGTPRSDFMLMIATK